MSKLVNGMMVGLVVFVVSLSVIWYALEIRRAADVSAMEVTARWGPVDSRTTEIVTDVRFVNSHRFDVRIVSVEHELLLNGVRLDWDASANSMIVPSSADETLELSSRIPTSFVTGWLHDHLVQGEESNLLVRGNASIQVGTERVNRDFAHAFRSQTDLGADMEDSVKNCGAAELHVCIRETRIAWGGTPESPELQAVASIRNENGGPVTIRNVSADLVLHGMVVARDGVTADIQIPANGEAGLPVTLAFQAPALQQWWPLHAGSCERSAVALDLRFTLDEPETTDAAADGSNGVWTGAVVTEVSWRFDVGDFTTKMFCKG